MTVGIFTYKASSSYKAINIAKDLITVVFVEDFFSKNTVSLFDQQPT